MALCNYSRFDALYTTDDEKLAMAFRLFRKAIDRDRAKYNEKCERNAKNRTAGWEKAKQQEAATAETAPQDGIYYDTAPLKALLRRRGG